MSIYSSSTGKNVLNVAKALDGIDASTRNQYYATILGFDAGTLNQGKWNTFVGYKAGSKNKMGMDNVYLGANAGQNATESDNIIIGAFAGQFLTRGSENVLMGTNTGKYSNGYKNILIGFNNTPYNDGIKSSCNIGIGDEQINKGYNNISIGRMNMLNSSNSIAFGVNINDSSTNAMLLGNNITNYGSNVLILKNRHSNITYSNIENNYTNINDLLISGNNSNNDVLTTLYGDYIKLQARDSLISIGTNIDLLGSNARMTIGDVINIGGLYSKLILDQRILLQGSNVILDMNNDILLKALQSYLFLGSNIILQGSNVELNMANDILLKALESYLFLGSNIVLQGSNVSLTMANDVTLKALQSYLFLGSNILLQGSNVYMNMTNDIMLQALQSQFFLGSNILLKGSNVQLSMTDDILISALKSELYLGSNIYLKGSNVQFVMDNNIFLQSLASSMYLGEYIGLRGSNLDMMISSNNITIDSDNAGLINFVGSNINITLSSNEFYAGGPNISYITLQSSNSALQIEPSSISLYNSNANYISIQGSNFGILFTSNNMYAGGDNMGTLQLYVNNAQSILNSNLLQTSNQWGNMTISPSNAYLGTGDNSLNITSNYIGLCNLTNKLEFGSNTVNIQTSDGSYISMTPSNTSIYNDNVGISITDRIKLDGNIELGSGVAANDGVFNSNLVLMDKLQFSYCNIKNNHWDIYLEPKSMYSSDLLLKSVNNTTITFTDDFKSELLNFTGKHRCNVTLKDKYKCKPGLIVSSIGKYKDLNNKSIISIDESLPIVKISNIQNDPCIFGVVCNIEDKGTMRSYNIGNMRFTQVKNGANVAKIVVNSHGEGGVWVCNTNGNLKNGDLITSAGIKGLGMKQTCMSIMPYTVGKITCDCDFSTLSKIYKTKYIKYNGKIIKKAFVGCVYKF